jgi:hypothetical protein
MMTIAPQNIGDEKTDHRIDIKPSFCWGCSPVPSCTTFTAETGLRISKAMITNDNRKNKLPLLIPLSMRNLGMCYF